MVNVGRQQRAAGRHQTPPSEGGEDGSSRHDDGGLVSPGRGCAAKGAHGRGAAAGSGPLRRGWSRRPARQHALQAPHALDASLDVGQAAWWHHGGRRGTG